MLAFGSFEWTLASAWRHVLLCFLGSVCTTVSVWAVFRQIFPECDGIDDDDADRENDVSDALRDLGEVGFFVGYFGAQALYEVYLQKQLLQLGIKEDPLNSGINTVTLVLTMMWVLSTKMRDYLRAVERRNNAKCAGMAEPSGACVQVV